MVFDKNMLKNTQLYGGIIYSQKVLLKLVEKGLTREEAYKIVQKHAIETLDDNTTGFKTRLQNDSQITKLLVPTELEECFNVENYLHNINTIFKRFE